ncbi:MAG: hypothetical protein ACYDC0_16875 [Acidimicrobiales bacterium]
MTDNSKVYVSWYNDVYLPARKCYPSVAALYNKYRALQDAAWDAWDAYKTAYDDGHPE